MNLVWGITIGIRAFDLGAMAARNSGQRLDGMAALSREMKEIFISFNKKLDLLFKMQEEALMKKMVHKSVSVTKAGLAGGGNESDLNGIAEDEPNLVDDEEIKMSLSDSYEVGPELLGDEEITPDLTSTDGFKVELTSSAVVDEVVSETRFFGAAKNHQLGAITNHGWTGDQISKILTEQGAAKSPSSASTKKKKKKKTTSFVKDRGKTPTLQRRERRLRKINGKVRRKADQNPNNARSSASASASEKKTTKAATFVKDRGKPCVVVRGRGRRGSMTAARNRGSSKKEVCGCEEAWSRRVAMRRQQWCEPEVRWRRGNAEDPGKVRIVMKRGGGKVRRGGGKRRHVERSLRPTDIRTERRRRERRRWLWGMKVAHNEEPSGEEGTDVELKCIGPN